MVGSPNHPTNLDTKSPGNARLDYCWRHVLSRVIKDKIVATIQCRMLTYPPPPHTHTLPPTPPPPTPTPTPVRDTGPSHNVWGQPQGQPQGPWTHFMPVSSRAMDHWQLTTLMGTDWVTPKGGHRSPNMGDYSTGTVLSFHLADAVYQSNTMDNLALMSQLFHPLAESHGQTSMEVVEKVSPTASLHRPHVQTRQWVLPFQNSLTKLRHNHPI